MVGRRIAVIAGSLLALAACAPNDVGSPCRMNASVPRLRADVDCVSSVCTTLVGPPLQEFQCFDGGASSGTCDYGVCRAPCTKTSDCGVYPNCSRCGDDGFCAENPSSACERQWTNEHTCAPQVRDACGGFANCAGTTQSEPLGPAQFQCEAATDAG